MHYSDDVFGTTGTYFQSSFWFKTHKIQTDMQVMKQDGEMKHEEEVLEYEEDALTKLKGSPHPVRCQTSC